jgi:hypothetical protein
VVLRGRRWRRRRGSHASSRGGCARAGRARGRSALGQRGDAGAGVVFRRARPSCRDTVLQCLFIRPPWRGAVGGSARTVQEGIRCWAAPRRGASRASRSSRSSHSAAYRPLSRVYRPVRPTPFAGRTPTCLGSYACVLAYPRACACEDAFRGAESRRGRLVESGW